MSDCRYDLEITSSDPEEIKLAMQYLKDERIVPEMLNLEAFDDSVPTAGLPIAWYSTEAFRPYGTIPRWDAEDHEKFFNDLSMKIPGATIIFRGEDIDAPEVTKFKKAFHNGQFKEAYQEVYDLDDALAVKPWRPFGAPESLVQQEEREEDKSLAPDELVVRLSHLAGVMEAKGIIEAIEWDDLVRSIQILITQYSDPDIALVYSSIEEFAEDYLSNRYGKKPEQEILYILCEEIETDDGIESSKEFMIHAVSKDRDFLREYLKKLVESDPNGIFADEGIAYSSEDHVSSKLDYGSDELYILEEPVISRDIHNSRGSQEHIVEHRPLDEMLHQYREIAAKQKRENDKDPNSKNDAISYPSK